MSRSARVLSVPLVLAIVLLASAAHAQTATCNFHLFQLNASDASNPVISAVNGANKFGTTVGSATPPGQQRDHEGFIRFADGSVKYFLPSGASRTFLNARNDSGVTVGYWGDTSDQWHGFLLQGSTVTAIVDPAASPTYGRDTRPFGINKWNTIVGQFLPDSGQWTSFKRYSNGSFVTLMYPHAAGTYASAINDSGMIVGTYYDANYVSHGFLYFKGQWSTLDYPDAAGTGILGIDDSGAMLGNAGWTEFLYRNGAFEPLPSAPNSSSTVYQGMSLGGVLTGTVTDSAGMHGFTATCP